MEPMMVRCILGDRDPDESLYDHVVAAVRDYIDRTTGIQTLVTDAGTRTACETVQVCARRGNTRPLRL